MEKVIIELCGGQMPQKQTEGAAAYDLYVKEETEIPTCCSVVPLGFRMQIPKGYAAIILPRSGCSVKGIEGRLVYNDIKSNEKVIGCEVVRFAANAMIGLIDSDYRGEVGVMIRNEDTRFLVSKGQRIAQMIVIPLSSVSFELGQVDVTERGEGGFGSTNQ